MGPAQRVVALVAFGVVGLVYLLRLDGYAGLMIDDAWYMVLAQALASGEGFRLISSSVTPILPAVPPGFPALLAPVFLVSPSYPDNLMLLKSVSLLATAGIGVTTWIDYTRHRGVRPEQAIWLIVVTLLIPSAVFLATATVMAEASFTCAQMLSVLAIERIVRRDSTDQRAPILAGLSAAVTMLIRTAGVAIVAAGVAYLVAQKRWRQASIFAVVAAASLAPWFLYTGVNASSAEERLAHGGSFAYTYSELLAMEDPWLAPRPISYREMAVRAGRNVADIVTRDVGALMLPSVYRSPAESGNEVISVGRVGRGSMGGSTGTMIIAALFSAVMLTGIAAARAWLSLPVLLIAASMVVIGAVGSQTFRYVVPLAPFLVLFWWRGLGHPAAARIALACVLALQLADHAFYLRLKLTGTPPWLARAGEVDEVLNWLNVNIAGDAAVASSNPGLVYLRTGRKGVSGAAYSLNWERWKLSGVRYLAALKLAEKPPARLYRRVVFQAKSGLWIVEM